MNTYYCYHKTPIGKLLLAGDGKRLSLLGFPSGSMARSHERSWVKDDGRFQKVISQLDAYFAGELQHFDLALAPEGTAFQQQVWDALREIPYGETWSYGELAGHIGRPKASRAVGAANGLNPIPIIIPCHRVIGSNGKLTGFGGGLDTKRFLLQLEAEQLAPGLGFGG
ncbi:MAG: methylated-DNA--[protein]-cysteine S-methyltransferase [Gammaproteobacteria bacterium]